MRLFATFGAAHPCHPPCRRCFQRRHQVRQHWASWSQQRASQVPERSKIYNQSFGSGFKQYTEMAGVKRISYHWLLATKQGFEEYSHNDDNDRGQNRNCNVWLRLSLLNHILGNKEKLDVIFQRRHQTVWTQDIKKDFEPYNDLGLVWFQERDVCNFVQNVKDLLLQCAYQISQW